jgi:DNA-binding winged helix-turn-helix (wHTH) protein/TolB-like protein/Tfp pilus assembly protein PilF
VDAPSKSIYQFGPFTVDAARRVLLRDGEAVPLTPKAFDTLLVLVEHSGKVLEKDRLLDLLWPDSIVEEANLTYNISLLRKALGESPGDRRYIITIPGRGYRFGADVSEIDGEIETEAAEVTVERYRKSTLVIEQEETNQTAVAGYVTREGPRVASNLRGWKTVTITLAGLGLLVLLAIYLYPSNRPAPKLHAGVKTLAVLPFKHLDAESGDEYLGLGMADSLVTKLTNVRQVVVRPTSAILKYARQEKGPAEAGRELGVETVLEGTIRRSGDNIRVTVQLVRVEDGSALWAEKFDESFTDMFKIEDSISSRVAESLVPKLTGEEREALANRYTENTEAYQLYLKGRYHWNKHTQDGIDRSIEYFNQAIGKDPAYALAYAGLADSYLSIPTTDDRPVEAFQKGREAAGRALEIDDRLAEAYTSMGTVRFWFDWDWAGAERDFKRAIECNPNSAQAHFRYAHLLSNMGRHEESIAEVKRALALDPLSLLIISAAGQFFYHKRDYDQALDQARNALEIDQSFWIAHALIGRIYTEKRMYGDAIAELEKAVKLSGGNSVSYSHLGYAFAASGNREKAEKVINELKERSKQSYVPSNNIARIYAGLGEKQQALDLLERALNDRETGLTFLKVVPQWDAIRQEPRFKALLGRIGFTE